MRVQGNRALRRTILVGFVNRWLLLFGCLLAASILVACSRPAGEIPPLPVPEAEPGAGERPRFLQRPAQDNDIRFEHISLEEGLSQSTVRSILQDQHGFMWFATVDGLNRYDGYEFTIFKHDPANPASLSENFIWTMYMDSQGTIWIGTEGGGLDQFDHGTQQFIHYQNDPDNPRSLSSDFIRSIHEDRDGNLWVGTLNGLNKLDQNTGRFTHYPNERAYPEDIYSSNYITAIQQDAAGKLWVGTMNGLYEFDAQQAVYRFQPLRQRRPSNIPEGPSPTTVYTIFEEASGNFWIGSATDGLFLFDPSIGKVTNYPYVSEKKRSLGHPSVNAIQQDRSGDLWIGTGTGLDKLEARRSYFIHYRNDPRQQHSLDGTSVASIFEDASGILWVGTNTGGINKYDPLKTKFLHVQTDPDRPDRGISSNKVWSICEDQRAQLWIATDNGLDMWNQDRSRFIHYYRDPTKPDSLPGEQATSILEDRSGILWIGTDSGLARFDDQTKTFTTYRHDPSDPFSINHPWVSEIYQDHFGQLWVGTAGGGLDRLDRSTGRFTHYPYREEDQLLDTLNFNYITALLDDNAGNLWVASLGGLARYDFATEKFTYYTHDPINKDSLSHDYVNAIHLDQSNNLWLGTGFGIDRFEPSTETFIHFREQDGLSNNMVLAILEDKTGTLWLSTNRGLSSFDPQSETFENYDTGDGLQALEFISAAAFRSPTGEMFFGGINGFNAFYPEDIQDNPYKPPIVVTDFQILNRSVSTGPGSPLEKAIYQTDRIELSSKDTAFSFEIAALHYGSPEENQYAYIMEGFDKEWNLVGKRRFATFTNLPPGDYTFKAIGSNSDGYWNTEGTRISVSIPFPFWQNWWFIGLTSLVLLGGVAGAAWLRNRSGVARTLALEEQVVERTVEIDRRRQIAEVLREILVIINSNRSLEESLHYIVDRAAQLTDAEDSIVFQLGKNNAMTIIATNPGGQIRYEPGEAILDITREWAIDGLLDKRPLIIPDLSTHWKARPLELRPSLASHRALLGIPLLIGDEVYGGLFLFYTEERTFSEEDRELGFTIGDQAALAIGNDRLRERAKKTAVAMERSRLARELHDAVTQTIFSASLLAETLPTIWENDKREGRRLLQELRQLTRGALAEMRTLLLELRPSALEEANLSDLLNQLAEAVTGRTGVPVSATIDRVPHLPTNVRVALYRIAQESLNNVMKHARATRVDVSLCNRPDDGVVLSVSDNGRGFNPRHVSGDHLGLDIIRERAQAIEAVLHIESQPGKGTRVTVDWDNQDNNSGYE